MSEKTITVSVNEAYMTRTIEARTLLSDFLRQDPLPDRNPCRVRTWRLRCLHRHSRWKERTLLSDACSAGRRERNRNHGQGSVDTRTNPRSVPPASWPAMRICRPSFIVAIIDLLRHHPLETDQKIREALSGNICRCTGYENIVNAVRELASKRGPLR